MKTVKVPITRCLHEVGRCFSSSAILGVKKKVLNMENMNPNVKQMEFAVRGPIVIRSSQLAKELENGSKKPFNRIVKANIGDAHDMGQQPITFIRQLVACVAYPPLMKSSKIPEDVKEHARDILNDCGGQSVGSYGPSPGIECIRKHCAEYISKRDGIPADYENIIITSGATEGIRNILKLFVNDQSPKKVGIMIPIPQYPLYSATIDEFGLGFVKYHLDEEKNWALDISELEKAFQESLKQYDTRVICVINPGNPTGQVLTKKNIEEVIRFAHRHNLVILADEVYQNNIYDKDSQFFSFKKVMHDLGDEYRDQELYSFYSVSKGYMGECGFRAGYTEAVNMDPEVFAMLKKMISTKLCSSIIGQVAMDGSVKRPDKGDPSYDLWYEETSGILNSLKERAKLVQEAYGALDGIECTVVQGAMYAYPRLHLPPKAIEKAKSQGVEPDFLYAMQLLEETGICTVPGSGFGQKEGTYHFRTTILPQTDMIREMLDRFKPFHSKFIEEYK